MLLRQRQSHRLRQRTLLLLAVLACNPALAEEESLTLTLSPPANSLRSGHASQAAKPTVDAASSKKAAAKDKVTSDQRPRDLTKTASDKPTVATAIAVPLFPLSQSELVTQTPVPLVTPLSLKPSPAEMLLVSDGWNARKAVDQNAPLVDPGSTAPSYTKPIPVSVAPTATAPLRSNASTKAPSATAGESGATSGSVAKPQTASAPPLNADTASTSKQNDALEQTTGDWTREPKSTLKFIISPPAPQTGAPTNSPPAREPVLTPSTSSREIKSPEPLPQKLSPPAQTQAAESEETAPDASEHVTDSAPLDETVLDPEQNEPSRPDKQSVEPEDSDEEAPTDVEQMPLEEMGSDLDQISRGSEELEELPADDTSKPERLEVRELKLDTDGSLATKEIAASESKRSQITPTKSAGSRQSVGDEPVPPKVATRVPLNVDRVGPKGELILAIGMDTQRFPLTAHTSRLRVPIERTLNHYWNKPEDAEERTHWGMFHNIMIYDKDTPIIANKRKFNAVAWMAGNNACRNQLLFEEDSRGINVKSGVGLQGHQAQMLAVFGLIDVPAAYPLYVGRNRYSVQDVIRREMLACQSGNELTFTLIGMAHYVDSDSQWVADDGQDWNVERLIQEELSQPIVGAACGGTHRLMGFAHALRRRRAEGKPITGQWDRADQYVNDFIAYTWQLQNRDGSMSTAWFEQPEDNGKIDRKLQTTGHMLEFLLTAVSDDQLQSAPMLRTVNFLANTLYEERGHEWQVGPKGHALRALAMYYRRVFGRPDPWRPVAVARHSTIRTR